MQKLLDFINRLEQPKIHYTLEHNRDETVMVLVVVPGERWEVEFYADGEVEIEVFRSQGVIAGTETELERLFKECAE